MAKTDLEIRLAVLEELLWDPAVVPDHISVRVADGTVFLRGYVTSYLQKWSAEKAVERVADYRIQSADLRIMPDADKESLAL